jgi:hypothetical protein
MSPLTSRFASIFSMFGLSRLDLGNFKTYHLNSLGFPYSFQKKHSRPTSQL